MNFHNKFSSTWFAGLSIVSASFYFWGQFESTKLYAVRKVLDGKVRNFSTTKISSFTVWYSHVYLDSVSLVHSQGSLCSILDSWMFNRISHSRQICRWPKLIIWRCPPILKGKWFFWPNIIPNHTDLHLFSHPVWKTYLINQRKPSYHVPFTKLSALKKEEQIFLLHFLLLFLRFFFEKQIFLL